MAKTGTQVRDALKVRIDAVSGDYNVYTNKFMKSKEYPCIVLERAGSVNYLDAYNMQPSGYKFNVYVLDKLDTVTQDDSGDAFDSGLDTVQDAIDIKTTEVLNSIYGLCNFVSENSNPILDFTDGNNRLVGSMTEVRAENRC